MPVYNFRDETTGKIIEKQFSMRDVPPVGATVSIDGRTVVRVVSDFQIDTGANRNQYPYLSRSLPRNIKGCKTNKAGQPWIASKKHEREVAARHGMIKT